MFMILIAAVAGFAAYAMPQPETNVALLVVLIGLLAGAF